MLGALRRNPPEPSAWWPRPSPEPGTGSRTAVRSAEHGAASARDGRLPERWRGSVGDRLSSADRPAGLRDRGNAPQRASPHPRRLADCRPRLRARARTLPAAARRTGEPASPFEPSDGPPPQRRSARGSTGEGLCGSCAFPRDPSLCQEPARGPLGNARRERGGPCESSGPTDSPADARGAAPEAAAWSTRRPPETRFARPGFS